MPAKLEMRRITKQFPGVTALEDVSIEARSGELLSIVGENGAGKSTLMKILSGAYPANSFDGQILIDGTPVTFRSPQDSEAHGIAMIYQEIQTHLDLSVAENIFLGTWPQRYGRIHWNRMNRDAARLLETAGLDVAPEQLVRELNTSQQQLMCIAAALARNPRILVLDEPTSALTEDESDRLFDILHRLRSDGIAAILISHKLDEVFANSDRITVLRDGQVISNRDIDEATHAAVVADMVGREMSDFYRKEDVQIGNEFMEFRNFTVPHPFNPKKDIVRNVSFSIRKGEILGIAGLVGSGRSELVNSIFGKGRRRSGDVFVHGDKRGISGPQDAIRNGIALVTEDRKMDGFVDVLNVQENTTLASLSHVSRLGRLIRLKERAAATRWFKQLQIKAPGLGTLLATLSGGNQQKVVLAKWLMTTPKLLILDDPTRGIDVGAKQEIYRIMTGLVRNGMSIILISSELPELVSMSDRVLVLSNGIISAELERDALNPERIMHFATSHQPDELESRING